jgi:hypothetical protein
MAAQAESHGVRPMAVNNGGQTPASRPFKITARSICGL